MNLIEWSTHYIKFKDCMKKNILDMNISEHTIIVKEKQQDIRYLVYEELQEAITQLDKGKQIIITNNTKKNFDELINQWNILIAYDDLTIIFSQPKRNETWSIRPSTHHKITEETNLKEGLLTLFENVARV